MALLQFRGRDIIPYTSDSGSTVIINHNFCSEPILKKIIVLAKTISVSGHNLPGKTRILLRAAEKEQLRGGELRKGQGTMKPRERWTAVEGRT